MVNYISTLSRNLLLASLSSPVKAEMASYLKPVTLSSGSVLYQIAQPNRYLYFPEDSLVSLLNVTKDGKTTEIADVGSEGFIGMPLLTGGESTTNLAVVECSGSAFQLASQDARNAFQRHSELFSLLVNYLQVFAGQVSQITACNRHHSIEQQLCRKLLLTLDRLSSNQIHLTQEKIANMLGVRRESVTEAANKLQSCGAIHYRRGHIEILNRNLLEQHSCECYVVIKLERERMLSALPKNERMIQRPEKRPAISA